jgi:hypothetical protein
MSQCTLTQHNNNIKKDYNLSLIKQMPYVCLKKKKDAGCDMEAP